jgi:hypothetical protein
MTIGRHRRRAATGISSNPSHRTNRIGAVATLRLMQPSAHRSMAVDATVAASLDHELGPFRTGVEFSWCSRGHSTSGSKNA